MKACTTLVGAALAAALLSFSVQPGSAADAQNKYRMRGIGAFTCAKYLEERQTDLAATSRYADWLTGYLTAYNFFQPQTFDIAPNHDANGLLTFLDLYCAQSQDQLIGQAAQAFVRALYPKRQVAAE